MSFLINQQPASFSIHPLKESATSGSNNTKDEIIAMFLVLNGKVVVHDKEVRVLLSNNNLYCTSANNDCTISVNRETEGYIIRFSRALLYSNDGDFNYSCFSAFQTMVLTGKIMQVEDSFLNEGKKLCEMMLQEFRNEQDFKMPMLSAFLNIFLFHLMRKLNSYLYNTRRPFRCTIVHQFNQLLEQHFKTAKKVSDYANLLSITPNHLNDTIRRATGQSAGNLIRQRVVLEAVRQARLTGASMKEVAYSLGFNDNAHFSKFFKKAAGKNFTEVKKYLFNKTMVSLIKQQYESGTDFLQND